MAALPIFLKFYVNPAWRRQDWQPTLFLFPFWGNPFKEGSIFAKEMFDAHSMDTRYYGIVDDISKADMVLIPYKYQWYFRYDMASFEECVKTAREANLPVLIDAMGDIDYAIDVPNAYVLRIGGYRFIPPEPGRIQLPPAVDDLLERCAGGVFKPRPKREGQRPVVSFAGWAQLTLKQALRAFIKELPQRLHGLFDSRYRAMKKGVFWRAKAVCILKSSPKVKTNFKIRSSFSGNAKTAGGDMRVLRQEFVELVLDSDYALDVRGDPNDSARLFEICSLGRIPVTIDTERNFPFSDVLNYRDFCLIVDFRDLKRLPDIIADFHARIPPEKFLAMQHKAREAFVNYFRIDAFMPQIVRLMESQPRG